MYGLECQIPFRLSGGQREAIHTCLVWMVSLFLWIASWTCGVRRHLIEIVATIVVPLASLQPSTGNVIVPVPWHISHL